MTNITDENKCSTMDYEIKNEHLKVRISSKGGEFQSICDAQGREYLWQGDEATWTDRGPNLFPYIGRMTDKSYTYKGQTYHMEIHGFLMYSEMQPVKQEEDLLVMKLESSEETLKQYPFAFKLQIRWKLTGDTLEITYQVYNCDTKTMYFGIGGHPGFIIPVEEGLTFEDYMLDFGENAHAMQVCMSEDCFVFDKEETFELRENRFVDLRHDLFDNDAIILHEMPRSVTISSPKGSKKITVSYPDMDYLGIWHWPKTEVPYVCIEPWSSLPSGKDIVEDLEKQKNLIALEAGQRYENKWSIQIK